LSIYNLAASSVKVKSDKFGVQSLYGLPFFATHKGGAILILMPFSMILNLGSFNILSGTCKVG